MKHKLVYLVTVLSFFSILTGCITTQIGNITGSASLNAPNFTYNKQNIFGEATTTYVLSIGSESRQSLIMEAKKNMLKRNPLQKNQALANVSVSYRTTHFIGFLMTTVNCTVSADVVEFGPAQTDFSLSDSQKTTATLALEAKTDTKKANVHDNRSIMAGDSVHIINYFSHPVEGKVLDVRKDNMTVEYTNPRGKVKKAKVLEFQVKRID